MSGFGELNHLELAFEYGASDYIIKPMRLRELELRMFNWFRNHYLSNMTFSVGAVCSYEELSFDLEKNEFHFKNILIPLTKNGKYALSLFLANPRKLLSEAFFAEKFW